MFKKTYLSREVSRALASMGEPVGDPFGGPAYGERRMPMVAAVVAAGWTASTVAMIATAVAQVGMGMMVAGAVTGNKNLMKYGGFMALAGGLTAMGAGAGMFGAENAALSVADAAAGAAAVPSVAPAGESLVTATDVATSSPVTNFNEGLLTTSTTPPPVGGTMPGMSPGTLGSAQVAPAVAPTPAVTPAPVAPVVAPAPAPAPLVAGNPAGAQINTLATNMGDGVTAQASTLQAPSSAAVSSAGAGTGVGVVTPGVAAPTPGFNLGFMKDIFTGKNAGFAIQGVGMAISGYANGKTAEAAQKYREGRDAAEQFNVSYAGRRA